MMPRSRLNDLLDHADLRWVLPAVALCMILVIAFIDWRVDLSLSIGVLYVIPVMLVSVSLPRGQMIVTALACAVLQESFARLPEGVRVVRLIFSSIGFVATGLFLSEILDTRAKILRQVEELKQSILCRRDAEEQLRLIVDTSPAAIVTIDEKGEILFANESARELLDEAEDTLRGRQISAYLPTLQAVVTGWRSQVFRTLLQDRGQRGNCDSILAGVWVSTYPTLSGQRLTAIIADLSDDLVTHGTSSVDYTLRNSSALMSGMTYEVRIACSAMRVIHKNLGLLPELARNEDFRSLDSLLQSLDKISTEDLRNPAVAIVSMVQLSEVMDELRVLVDNTYKNSGISVRWSVEDSLPQVRADRFGLVQVFFNLASNSKRAMQSTARKELRVATTRDANAVVIRFLDTGAGINAPEKLFRPFQPGTGVASLDLYVSRTIMRSFGGDLRYEGQSEGSCFAVVIPHDPRATRIHATSLKR